MNNDLWARTQNYLRFLDEKIVEKPLVLPVIFAVVMGIGTYKIKSIALIYAVLILYLIRVLIGRWHSKELAIILTTSVMVGSFVGYRVVSVYSSRPISDSGDAVVISANVNFDGENEVVVIDENGNRIIIKTEDVYEIGTKVHYSGVRTPESARNPGAMDYRDYLYRRNIKYSAKAISKIENAPAFWEILNSFTSWCNRTRFSVFNRITSNLDEESRSLAAAVFLGDKSLLNAKQKYAFQHSGCAHILAVSGTHISSFLMLIPYVLNKSVRNRTRRGLVYSSLCLLLGCFTGWSESVTRACIMSVCSYSSRDYLSGMSLSALIMILTNPFTVLSTGFQMSYMASLGIYLLTPKIVSKLEKYKLHEVIINSAASYMSVQLSMLPFFTVSSTHLSIFNVIAQLINNTLAGVACVFFVPTALVSVIPLVGELFSMVTITPLLVILFVSKVTSRAMKYSINLRFIGQDVMVIMVLWLVVYLIKKSELRKCLCLLLSAITALVAIKFAHNNITKPDVTVVFIDVGQGDSCLIIADDKSCLIDTGVADSVLYSVVPVLDYYGIDCVDYCIATHWDLDHAGGIGELADLGRISNVYSSCINISDEVGNEWNTNQQESKNIHIYPINTGDSIVFGKDVYIDVLSPDYALSGDNEESLVMMLTAMNTKILFTGDIGQTTEAELISNGIDLDSDVLKVAHHGSRYSTTSEFIETVSPELAVISVGKYNLYGHPNQGVIDRLEESDCAILRTDIYGAIVIEIREEEYQVVTWLMDNESD